MIRRTSKTLRHWNSGASPRSFALGALLLGAVLAGAGCENDSWARTAPSGQVDFAIHPSHTDLLVGETATITVESHNTLGRDPHIDWSASGGKLNPESNGRVARIIFEQPGTYLVSARLLLGDQLVRTDSVTFTVHPIP